MGNDESVLTKEDFQSLNREKRREAQKILKNCFFPSIDRAVLEYNIDDIFVEREPYVHPGTCLAVTVGAEDV